MPVHVVPGLPVSPARSSARPVPLVVATVATVALLLVAACHAAPDVATTAHHELTVRLEPEVQRLEGRDRITVEPSGAEALRLRLSPGAEVTALSVNGEERDASLDGGVLDVALPAGAQRGETTVEVSYRAAFRDRAPAAPANTEDPSYGVVGTIGPEGVFLDAAAGWYPDVAESRQDFRVRVEGPEEFEAITQGRRADRGVDGAARYSVWEVAHPVSGLSLSAGPYVVGESASGDVPIYTYFYREDGDVAASYREAVARYLALYRDLFGPYPFEKFAVVENFFPTGYGFPSYTLLGRQIIRLPFIRDQSLGHEVAHSWWGNGVLVDYEHGNWSEGLATYVADYLYRERASPKAAREYRRNILRDYATLVPPGEGFPLRAFTSRDSPASRAIGYGKSAMVFHMVRQRIGDRAFWDALRAVAHDKMFQRASWTDFRDAFARRGSTDLTAFFQQWVDRPGAPVLALEGVHLQPEDSGWVATGTLVQDRPFFDLRVPVALDTGNGTVPTRVPLRDATSRFRLTSTDPPEAVAVDPDVNLFRRLAPEELPPTVNAVRGSTALRVVEAGGLDEETRAACRVLLEGMGLTDAPVSSEGQVPAGGDVLYLGWPKDPAALPPLPDGFAAGTGGFTVEGTRYDAPGDALFLVARRASAPDRVVAVFHPLSAAAARAAAPKIAHYGKYSYLAFQDGRNRAKGTWPVTRSPARYRFAQADPPLSTNDRILDLGRDEVTRLPRILDDLASARVVFVGELHDQAWHHWAQLQVILGLYDAGIPLAVGLEMFAHRDQWALDHWVSGEMSEEAFVRVFAADWDADYWPVYRDLFLAARQHGIPLVALNLPRDLSARVAMAGFDALTAAQRARLPRIESCNAGPEYRQFIRKALGDAGHHGLDFTHFCEAQLLWDTTMARRLVAYLEANPSRHVVVLAGSGHSWKEGIPTQLRRLSSVPYRVILPEMPGRLSRQRASTDEADYLWLGLTPGE